MTRVRHAPEFQTSRHTTAGADPCRLLGRHSLVFGLEGWV